MNVQLQGVQTKELLDRIKNCTHGVLNLQGLNIQGLPELPKGIISLNCDNTYIHSLPKLPSTLQRLSVVGSQIRSLPSLPEGLLALDVSHTGLQGLPRLPDALQELSCQGSAIEALPKLPDGLRLLMPTQKASRQMPNWPKDLDFNSFIMGVVHDGLLRPEVPPTSTG